MTMILNGMRKRPTYDSLVGYLDGEQERIKWPDRLATQLQNSYQISNLVDSEDKGWFQENKEQMRNFTEQQVKDILIKANLEPHQTFHQERILGHDSAGAAEPPLIPEWQLREEEAQKRERQEMAKKYENVLDMFTKM
jgi:alpha-galactosidase/6-phospho-beta-glucosidase family protein